MCNRFYWFSFCPSNHKANQANIDCLQNKTKQKQIKKYLNLTRCLQKVKILGNKLDFFFVENVSKMPDEENRFYLKIKTDKLVKKSLKFIDN